MKKVEENPFDFKQISRKTKIILTISLSCIFGLITALNPSSIDPFLNFVIATPIYMYIFYLAFGGYITRVAKKIPESYKKILKIKVFFFWVIFLLAWLFSVGFLIIKIHSQFLANFWALSVFAILAIYPCIYSLAVYIPLFQYLGSPGVERENRRNLANDLVVLTAGLGAPWLLVVLIFVIQNNAFPTWANYLIGIIVVYIATFFIAIDYPYYVGVEKEKKIKMRGLKQDRDRLLEKLEKLCNSELSETGLSERIAIELNIGRIDRDISEVKSESSHPYSPIKPVMGFIIVSILANIFVQIVLRFVLHIA